MHTETKLSSGKARFWVVVACLALCGALLLLAAKPLIRAAIHRQETATLRAFSASGRIEYFGRSRPDGRLGLYVTITERDDYSEAVGVWSHAFRIGSDVLKPDAYFEKKAGSNVCIVDGKEYVLCE